MASAVAVVRAFYGKTGRVCKRGVVELS